MLNCPVPLQLQIPQMPQIAFWGDLGLKCSQSVVNCHAVRIRCDRITADFWLLGAILGCRRSQSSINQHKLQDSSMIQAQFAHKCAECCTNRKQLLEFSPFYSSCMTDMIWPWFPWLFLTNWCIQECWFDANPMLIVLKGKWTVVQATWTTHNI